MSKEIHFLEDGYYVDKLEKDIQKLKEVIAIKEKQLEEVRKNKTDYTKVNILEMQLNKYKEVIEEIIEYIEKSSLEVSTREYGILTVCDSDNILQILNKVGDNNEQ